MSQTMIDENDLVNFDAGSICPSCGKFEMATQRREDFGLAIKLEGIIGENNQTRMRSFFCALLFPLLCDVRFSEGEDIDGNPQTKLTVKVRPPAIDRIRETGAIYQQQEEEGRPGVLMNKLEVKPYDPLTDTIEIEGTRFSGTLLRELGCNFSSMTGQALRIDKNDGVVTVTRLMDGEIGDAVANAAC